MKTSTRRFLTTGLSIATTLGLAMGVHALPEDPASQDPPSSGVARPGGEGFLLLNDGRVIPGVISREGAIYVVRQKLGVMRFPRKLVEGSYGSLQEAYHYKLAQLPEDDPSERLKLARWCLNSRLTAEAKAQLMKVLEISPDHGPAQAMLSKLEHSEATRGDRVDPSVMQTSGEEVAEDRAGALDAAVLRGAERGMGLSRLPVIFDIPQPRAIKCADEFARFIHPVLQLKCARCHNAGYEGAFQLVPVANNRQLTPDALRANLDATLRLIDPENPSKSELLSSTLRPHGSGPRKHPIFEGSNNRAYQILAAWVNSLGAQKSRRDPAIKTASGRVDEESERFGADRSRPAGSSLEAAMPGIATGTGRLDPKTAPAFRFKQGQGWESEDLSKSDPAEFPIPYMLGGPKPSAAKKNDGTEMKVAASPSTSKMRASAIPPKDKVSPEAINPAGAKAVDKNATPADSRDPGTVKKPRKPAKIDPAILEKLLQRNADRTPGQ